jgi:hypothetical protein
MAGIFCGLLLPFYAPAKDVKQVVVVVTMPVPACETHLRYFVDQLETYIRDHSEAQLSHGICRECAKKYYPDLDLYDDDTLGE